MHANSMESTKENTLLSQDVAVSLLQENKMALKRCELVRMRKWPCILSCYVLIFVLILMILAREENVDHSMICSR